MYSTYFFLDVGSFLLGEVLVVLVHSGFAVAADEEHEDDHGGRNYNYNNLLELQGKVIGVLIFDEIVSNS